MTDPFLESDKTADRMFSGSIDEPRLREAKGSLLLVGLLIGVFEFAASRGELAECDDGAAAFMEGFLPFNGSIIADFVVRYLPIVPGAAFFEWVKTRLKSFVIDSLRSLRC
jgi:hypothetical protein